MKQKINEAKTQGSDQETLQGRSIMKPTQKPKKSKKLIIRTLAILIAGLCLTLCLGACSEKTLLDPKDPITLTMWHVYGEQADSPMNRLIEEFNSTVGREKGIVINVSLMSSTAQIGEKLLTAQSGEAGAMDMPDLFFCHNNNAEELGAENLLDWNTVFGDDELSAYVPEFLEDGMVDGHLSVFPISKSTHLLFIAGKQFERFSAATGVTYDSLSTWSGFLSAAEKYYEYSGGKPFCALDFPIRAVELNMMEQGGKDIYTEDGWYNFENADLKSSYTIFAEAIAKGHIIVSDLYSNTQVMTGEVMAGLGSSASILYYNDTVTYPDNTSEEMDLQVLPPPTADGHDLLVTQAGVGLCAYKTTDQKAEAAAVFARWLTDADRNLDFCIETGYMPVNKTSFEKIKSYEFKSDAYKNLYSAISKVNDIATAVREPSFAGYYSKIYALYDKLRDLQKTMPERYKSGESAELLAEELWELFKGIK